MSAAKVFERLSDSALSGTWKCLFSEGNHDSDPALDPVYYDFGNVAGFGLTQETTTRPRNSYECGRTVLDQTIIQDQKIGGTSTLKEFPPDTIKALYRGADGENHAQTALAAVEVDDLEFSTTPAEIGRFYQLTNGGKKIFKVTNLTLTAGATTLSENTDYKVEKITGMVRFLTAQTADITVTVTAAAFDQSPILLQEGDIRRGKFRFLYFPVKPTDGSPCSPEMIIDSLGEIVFDQELTIAVDSDTEASVAYNFTGTPELWDLRNL